MSDEGKIAEIEERIAARGMAAGRNHGHMSEVDALEAHKDCVELLAIVKKQQGREAVKKQQGREAVKADLPAASEVDRLRAHIAELERIVAGEGEVSDWLNGEGETLEQANVRLAEARDYFAVNMHRARDEAAALRKRVAELEAAQAWRHERQEILAAIRKEIEGG